MIRRLWNDSILRWDTVLFTYVFGKNGRHLTDRLFYGLSKSADGYFYAVAALLAVILDPPNGNKLTLIAAIGFLMEIPLYRIIKNRFKRERPFRSLHGVRFLINPPDQFSFPSGHTAGAFLFAVAVSGVFPVMAVPCFLWAGAVGLSRVYLGVHYPTDVLAGAVLGTVCALAARWLA